MAEVTEADKECTVELAHSLGITCEDFTSGAADIIVQAFAVHREAAEKAERQAVVDWLREAAWIRGELGDFDVPEMRRELAQAIERGDHRKG